MEPEPKKRKLDRAWFISSVQELDVSDLAKQGMAEILSQIPEDVLHKDPPEKLMFYYLQDQFSERARRIVAGALHSRIKDVFPPASAHQLYCGIFLGLGLGLVVFCLVDYLTYWV